jgi:pSer/pThr/pTyr-binding forkhead associated (FHA) protein
MDVKLFVVEGKNAGQKIAVPGPKFFIGRAEDCHLRPASPEISRHHAVILVEDGYVAVRDFGSKNGTFLNGERVRGEHELKNGDRIRLGPLEFDVELAVEVGGKKKPKVKSIEEAAARSAGAVRPGGGDDLDIFGLLGEEDATVASAPAMSDTQNLDETQTTASEGEKEPGQPGKKPEERKKKDKEKKNAGLVGRFKDTTKPQAESSRTAAQDVLKQLMSRRR